MKQKKGIQLNQAFGAVLTLILVAVLVIVAIVIFVSLANTTITDETATITEESITPIAALAGANNCSSGSFSITGAQNDSLLLSNLNYSVNANTGILTNLTTVTGAWAVNYTYIWGGEGCEAADSLTTEFSNYTSLIGLVGTIIFLGLVIGILVASFAFGGRREV